MNKLLRIAVAGEAGTGLALLICPAIVIRLLFGDQFRGSEMMMVIIMSRIAGISLISLGIACWPRGEFGSGFWGMLTYSTIALLYLILVGIEGSRGVLLWPAVAAHAILSALLVRLHFNRSRSESHA